MAHIGHVAAIKSCELGHERSRVHESIDAPRKILLRTEDDDTDSGPALWVTLAGIELDALIASYFWLGSLVCRASERLGSGTLDATILSCGELKVGMPVEPAPLSVGVGVLFVRAGKLLLAPRFSQDGQGTWACPGGKPHGDEPLTDCAVRELWEETGLEGRVARTVASTVNGFPESRRIFRTHFVTVKRVHGKPERREPEKTGPWGWYPIAGLPEPLFAPVASLLSANVSAVTVKGGYDNGQDCVWLI